MPGTPNTTLMKCIILAGGSGTRLWPLSRVQFPKQFLKIGDHSLFQATWLRARKLASADEIYVVTNEAHQYLVNNQLEEVGAAIDQTHLLREPCGRNTLPAIAWAMATIRAECGDAVAVVFPSDHHLSEAALHEIEGAVPLAEDHLVTFGVMPDCPHTGYGYIRPGAQLVCGSAVDAFKEKPDKETAESYCQAGYLWNSGMFLLRTTVFFEELERYQPAMAAAFAAGTPEEYAALQNLSIDYGLLEVSERVAVVPLDCDWSDMGDFKALYEHAAHDLAGNAGKAEYIDATGNYVHAKGKAIGLIGVNNLAIVDTGDALLVCAKDQTDKVRDLVTRFKGQNNAITEHHLEEHRPWGSYKVLETGPFYKIKRVTVSPGKRLSLQLHCHRSEHWIVVSGMAEVHLNGDTQFLCQGQSTFVTTGSRHRLGNPGRIPLEVIEVQIGEYLEEDDIVRFEDQYGRA